MDDDDVPGQQKRTNPTKRAWVNGLRQKVMNRESDPPNLNILSSSSVSGKSGRAYVVI